MMGIPYCGLVAMPTEIPEDASAWRALGSCYLEIRQPATALQALERSLSADPEQPDTHYALGSACGTLGQLDSPRRRSRIKRSFPCETLVPRTSLFPMGEKPAICLSPIELLFI
jgi:Tetratricopeptide repeat